MYLKFYFFIVSIFYTVCVSSQDTASIAKIDSLKYSLQNSKHLDSLSVAITHYEIAELYRYSFIGDSAYYYYYKADKLFEALKNDFFLARTIYGIAVVQKNEKDFTASEVTSIKALSVLNTMPQSKEVKKYKSYIYNNLGLLFSELEQFEESIKYHNKAIELKKDYAPNDFYTISVSLNNIALAYKKAGYYSQAQKYYSDILSRNDLMEKMPNFHALVLDNYAHTQYLSGNTKNLPKLYFNALNVANSVNPNGGYNSIIVNQHLAEFYFEKNELDSAKHYAYIAKNIATNYSNDELLTSLLLVSKIEEGEKAAEHLRAYVKLNDSLQKAERKIRNKFARIRFETQQVEQENIRIARERFWLIIVSLILLLSGLLVYVFISQRIRKKEIVFAKQQQESNEEIYNLMLGQNEKIEEARTIEKKRISEELHDGVLGRLFGARLSLDSLNLNNTPAAIKTREQYIAELKTIEEDIRKVSHELNTDFISGTGFIDMIKTMVQNQTKIYNLDYSINNDDSIQWDDISNKCKIHIYRILQEALHNVYKHAAASKVNIGIKLKNDVICVEIEDDGAGFDTVKAKSGIGLKNMNSRINEVNGVLNIISERKQGTTVRITIPT